MNKWETKTFQIKENEKFINRSSFLKEWLKEVILQIGNDKKEEAQCIRMEEGTMESSEIQAHT